MRVHSFLPVVALSLVTVAVADDDASYFHGAIFTSDAPGNVTKRALSHAISARRASSKRDGATICEDLPSKWSYTGCYNDDPSNRALTGPSYHDDTSMKEENCIEFCDAAGYSMAGVEFGRECFCGYSLGASGTQASELDCNMPCTGNSDELCGAGGRLNVFTNGDSAPTVLATAGDFSSIGCFSDSASARTLTTRMPLSGNVRVTDCTSACSDAGFTYAGLEYGNECYCGSSIQNGGHPIADNSCNMACTADKSQLCGGPAAINIYHSNAPTQSAGNIPSGWASKSCYTDSVSGRALSHQISLDSSTFTTESCINACQSAGFSIAGTEYSNECFCGNTIDNGATPASSGCDMACSGNHGETCGGAARINIYEKNSCAGVPGCYNGSGLLRSLYTTLSGCLAACNADSNCVDIQYSHFAPEANYCNLFNVPMSQNYAVGSATDYSYCAQWSFYDKSCTA